MGVKGLVLAAALAVAPVAGSVTAPASVRYLESRQTPSGGFAEPGGAPGPGLTAWAVIGLRAAGVAAPRLEGARRYLERTEDELASVADVELAVIAQAALGHRRQPLLDRLRAAERRDGRIGPTVNSTIWGILALRAGEQRVAPRTVRYLLRRQARSGGWSWAPRGAADSNDTAAAVQALRAAGVASRSRAIRRALVYLRRLQNRDGGFELTPGRGSDVQSTAWCVQAFVAAGKPPPRGSLRYLLRLRRRGGSFRYSARYSATPAWVTAQALTALARKPLPLR